VHKVLIIDDEKMLLDNLKAFLEDEGYEVEASRTAESGLSKLNIFKPDAVIVDLRLQGVNGETFVKTAYGINPELRFLIHTGSKEYELSRELQQMGLSQEHIVYKPIADLSQLSNRLQHLAKR
jgi:DNA-binding NtrC family response regulator